MRFGPRKQSHISTDLDFENVFEGKTQSPSRILED